MTTQQIINELKTSILWGECPCGGMFRLRDAILFDGTQQFPPEAIVTRRRYEELLKKKRDDLKKNKKLTNVKAEITSKAVNIGGSCEKVLPTLKDFRLNLPDCRFLGNPIDMITFNGLSFNKVDSLSFIEVKTGRARLNKNQKLVKEAVEDHKVRYRVYK